jgi:hypothetical protein
MKTVLIVSFCLLSAYSYSQNKKLPDGLKINLNEDGSNYFQLGILNQTWLRFNQNNPGTLTEGVQKSNSFDIGLRRTRFQLFGQLTDKVFVYFQFGQNNFNAQYNTGSNRKQAIFIHDAFCEYKISKGNQLKIGGGLTISNGLSRFTQPGIASIMTLDVPIFAQTTVEQTDQFGRKLSVYVRGQVGKFDYRVVVSDPFPVTSSGALLPALSENTNFAQKGRQLQSQAYIIYQFLEHENHTSYTTGTYLGKKKIFNVAIGGILQKDAMWKIEEGTDTVYHDMKHFAVESFLDMPLSSKQDAISAYAGYFNTNYGTNYLRYLGVMNPANGTALNVTNSITGHGPTYGNAYPMFGTGHVIYSQLGYLFPENFLKLKSRVMPYTSFTTAKFDRLNGLWTNTINAGINYLINGHKTKFTLDWQNRPTYEVADGEVVKGKRLNSVTLQYQIFF